MDDLTEVTVEDECPLSSDGKHHMLRDARHGLPASLVCMYCDHGKYYPGLKVVYDDVSTIDLLALRQQARENPSVNQTELAEVEQELRRRGYIE